MAKSKGPAMTGRDADIGNKEFCKWLELVSDRFINSPNPHARYEAGVLISARKRIEKLAKEADAGQMALFESEGKK
jgi:hypothetical protein